MLDALKFPITAEAYTAGAFRDVKQQLIGVKGALTDVRKEAAAVGGKVGSIGRLFGAAGAKSGQVQNQMRMLAFQINQVGQQGLATGNYMQALTIQIPDMLAAFGSLKLILLGGAAAFGASMIPAIIGAQNQVESFGDALSSLRGEISSSRGDLDLLTNNFSGLRGEISGAVWDVKSLGVGIGQVSLRRLSEEADDLTKSLTAMYNGNAWINQSRREQLISVFPEMGRGVNALAAAIVRLRDADGVDVQITAAKDLRELFVALAGNVSDMTSAEYDYYTAILDTERVLRERKRVVEETERSIADATGAANEILVPFRSLNSLLLMVRDNASGLATEFRNAAAAAAALADNRYKMDTLAYSTRFSDEEALMGQSLTPMQITEEMRRRALNLPARSGGGGGMSELERATNAFQSLRGQIDPTWRALQDYNDAVLTLDSAQRLGLIPTQEEYNQLLQLTRQHFDEVSDGALGLAQDANGLKGVFKDVGESIAGVMGSVGQLLGEGLKGVKSWGDVFIGVLQSVGNALMNSGLDGIGKTTTEFFGPAVGDFLTGFLGSLFGFANGGSFTVGGGGGTDSQLVAFRATPNERVTITRPDQSGGSTGVAVSFAPVIDARGADNGAVARLQEALRRAQAEFEPRVLDTLRVARQRRMI